MCMIIVYIILVLYMYSNSDKQLTYEKKEGYDSYYLSGTKVQAVYYG